jgi:cytochrome oxidase Cu insertion factor (SCO1/SenC/PrrC family)
MARWGICRASALALLIVALLGVSARGAHADGDPASDYLIGNQVFLTSQSVNVSPAQRQLLATVRAATRSGFPIRVAVISSAYDLGSITALWGKPRLYARFLGQELSQGYRQRLLVVMPGGLGFYWPGHSPTAAYRLLAGVPLRSTGDGPSVAAAAAVRRLALAAGVSLAPARPAAAAGTAHSGGADWPGILAAVAGGLAALALVAFAVPLLRRRRRAGRRAGRREGRRAHEPAEAGAGLPVGLRWAIPGVGLLCAMAVAVPVLALHRTRPEVSGSSTVTPPPFSWHAGQRPAPDFMLRDQSGRPVSLAAYRGRPVIVTFVDPLCRNLCPLEAHVLNQTVSQMPAAQRPTILAVSVDVYANARANLLQDVGKWHLVPQWLWAVGSRSRLAAVWKRYSIGVSVTTKRIAGTTINYITHTEAAYVIDATGHERALFLWPFYPQDVKRVLRSLA